VACYNVQSPHSSGQTEEDYGKCQSDGLMTLPKFKLGTSQLLRKERHNSNPLYRFRYYDNLKAVFFLLISTCNICLCYCLETDSFSYHIVLNVFTMCAGKLSTSDL
jgi:hypothetical protein